MSEEFFSVSPAAYDKDNQHGPEYAHVADLDDQRFRIGKQAQIFRISQSKIDTRYGNEHGHRDH